MLDLLIGSLSEIKSYVVVLSFFIKIMKQRTFQACSLKHSTKKGMFYVQSKLNYFKSGRRGVLPPSPPPRPPWLRVCDVVCTVVFWQEDFYINTHIKKFWTNPVVIFKLLCTLTWSPSSQKLLYLQTYFHTDESVWVPKNWAQIF